MPIDNKEDVWYSYIIIMMRGQSVGCVPQQCFSFLFTLAIVLQQAPEIIHEYDVGHQLLK
jgi:hypothetical protein